MRKQRHTYAGASFYKLPCDLAKYLVNTAGLDEDQANSRSFDRASELGHWDHSELCFFSFSLDQQELFLYLRIIIQ
jgi:hypothetical protein